LQNSQHLIIYLLSFAVFLVVKSSSNKINHHKKAIQPKQKPTKKAIQPKQKPTKKAIQPKQKPTKKATSSERRIGSQHTAKRSPSPAKTIVERKADKQEHSEDKGKTVRPETEVVTYSEIDFQLREITPTGKQVLVGPPSLTRFERARITGARSLQLSLGAPALIKIPEKVKDSVTLASLELDAKALPISIRRVLPNGLYQDIPADWLK
jgi:DNA-directed RNA polymerases I, II, and III subunit RPABC2